MHLCMQDDQNGQKMMVLTSAEETRLTCFIQLQNIFFWSNQPSLTADVNTIINLPWYPRKIVHFSLVLSPSRVYYDFYVRFISSFISSLQILSPCGRPVGRQSPSPGSTGIKLFAVVIYKCLWLARVLVPGRPLQPSLLLWVQPVAVFLVVCDPSMNELWVT